MAGKSSEPPMTGQQSSQATLMLPQALDGPAAKPLVGALLALRGQPVLLDAQEVNRLGGLGLQVLLSAQATWQADGQRFDIVNFTPAMQATLALCGAAYLGT